MFVSAVYLNIISPHIIPHHLSMYTILCIVNNNYVVPRRRYMSMYRILYSNHLNCKQAFLFTHWGRATHIYVSKQTIIGSDNSLSPGRRQAIIWTNAELLLIGTLGTNFSEILIEIRIFSFKKMGLKVSSAKWRPFCLGLNVLSAYARISHVRPLQ